MGRCIESHSLSDSVAVLSKQKIMAEGTDLHGEKLSDIFEEGFNLYSKIDAEVVAFNSDEFQSDVKKGIQRFEDSTRLVNSIGMFSTNEIIDEIPTKHLKYLLLPFFLGQLSTKCMSYDREEALKIAQIYYKDFLKRCEDYGIYNSNGEEKSTEKMKSTDLVHIAQQRNAKIQMYRQKKELEEQVKQMKVALKNEHVDEEVKRKFYLKLIDLSIISAKEEIESVKQEIEILEFRKVRIDDEKRNGSTKPRANRSRSPLRPIIITKDKAQKAVFGMGYPSLPVITVDEFYEQRVKDGIFPNEEQVQEMNRKMMNPEDPEEKEERERAEKEILVENDDLENLERQRNFDEYKDEVRRGDGNRYNRS